MCLFRLWRKQEKENKRGESLAKFWSWIPEPLVTAHEVTQYPDDMERGDKVGSSIEGYKMTSVCVTPNPSLKTPPPYNNNQY